MIQILGALAVQIRQDAIDTEGRAFLQGVYGPQPSAAAAGLKVRFEQYLKARAGGDEALQASSRQYLLEDLEAEIAWFEKWEAVDRQARAELAAPQVEAPMLSKQVNLERSMLYQERLERRFEKKYKLLMRHRRMRQAEEREAELFGDPAFDTAAARSDDEFEVVGKGGPKCPPETPGISEGQSRAEPAPAKAWGGNPIPEGDRESTPKSYERSRQTIENTREASSRDAASVKQMKIR